MKNYSSSEKFILSQLRALKPAILLAFESRGGNGFCNYAIGETLNALRESFLKLHEDERSSLEEVIPPVEFDSPEEPGYCYSLSAQDACRLLLQLYNGVCPDDKETTSFAAAFDDPEDA